MAEEMPVHPVTGLPALGVMPSGRVVWPVLGAAEGDDDAGGDAGEGDTGGDGQDDAGDGGDLAEAGRKALAAERKARRDAERARKAAEKELADLKAAQQAKKDGDDAAAAADKTRRDAETAALAKANARILAAEVKAAAAGKLADPADAARYLDMAEFEVGDDGSVDAEAITEAISVLIQAKPYLAAKAQGFQGGGDGGARTGGSKPRQVTDAELKTMTPAQIVKAQQEGRLANLISGK
jgi:membrane protein involved in colicin uptake